jgi:hypothetical protein
MANMLDMEEPGGWLVRTSRFGHLARTFYVYELDNNKAAELVQNAISVTIGETVEDVKLLNIRKLMGCGMKPGDVKQLI